MKKVLIIFCFFIFPLFFPIYSHAQTEGEFICEWTGIECVANRTLSTCPAGTDYDDSKCAVAQNMNDCNDLGIQQCTEVEIDTDPDDDGVPDLNWSYEPSFGGCVPSTSGIYITREDCEAANNVSQRFRCVRDSSGTAGCQACDYLQDPECALTEFQCRDSCRLEETGGAAQMVAEGCFGGAGQVNTAIGCIPFDLISSTARFFLAWSLSIGGGVCLLLIGVSALMFATSSGIPDKVNSAKSLFWAAISGLLLIILSIFLLRAIGVDVLGLFS